MAKYPDVTVPLTGEDGNIFFIIGRARKIARRAGAPADEIDQFSNEVGAAQSYEDALGVVEDWFEVE